jgi:hypothetical protein
MHLTGHELSLRYAHRNWGQWGGVLHGGTVFTNPFSTNKCTVLLAVTRFGITADTHTVLLKLTAINQSYNADAYQLIRREYT